MNQINESDELVSVIITTYNGERFLAKSIESVLVQNYKAIEIIVVDDGSTDETAKIVSQFSDSVHYIYQSNIGQAEARNTGLRAAQGVLLAFLDHDDFWSDDKLSSQVKYLQDNPDIDYVFTHMKVFLEAGVKWPASMNREYYESNPIGFILGTMLIWKSAFLRVGFFNPNLRCADDADWFFRANSIGLNQGILNKVFLNKRIHGNNLSLYSKENIKELLNIVYRSVK